MNTYPPNLFETWPGDSTMQPLPTGARVASLFHGLYDQACCELPWLAGTAKHIRSCCKNRVALNRRAC